MGKCGVCMPVPCGSGTSTGNCKKILPSFFQCVKVALFFFRTPVHMHVLTIPPTRDRGYTDGRVKCRKPVEDPGTAPRVRVGNFVALLNFISWLLKSRVPRAHHTCETINKSSKSNSCYIDSDANNIGYFLMF